MPSLSSSSMQQAVISDETARSGQLAIEKCNVQYFFSVFRFYFTNIILYKVIHRSILHFRPEGVSLFPGRKQTPDHRISGRDPYHDQGLSHPGSTVGRPSTGRSIWPGDILSGLVLPRIVSSIMVMSWGHHSHTGWPLSGNSISRLPPMRGL